MKQDVKDTVASTEMTVSYTVQFLYNGIVISNDYSRIAKADAQTIRFQFSIL